MIPYDSPYLDIYYICIYQLSIQALVIIVITIPQGQAIPLTIMTLQVNTE